MSRRAVAVVKDLFFAARIRETARLVGAGAVFARTPDEIAAVLATGTADLAIVDLTTPGWDYDSLLGALERAAPRPPVLGYTTHVLARQTQPWHARCDRVVTKETLTQDLAAILRDGIAARPAEVPP
jgi:DNA-binding NarL/FixJ family response regulator